MKTLLILRHAKSGLKDPNIADHERPLDEPAKKDALQMGKLLRDRGLIPDFILSSTAVRAKTTAELVARVVNIEILFLNSPFIRLNQKTA